MPPNPKTSIRVRRERAEHNGRVAVPNLEFVTNASDVKPHVVVEELRLEILAVTRGRFARRHERAFLPALRGARGFADCRLDACRNVRQVDQRPCSELATAHFVTARVATCATTTAPKTIAGTMAPAAPSAPSNSRHAKSRGLRKSICLLLSMWGSHPLQRHSKSASRRLIKALGRRVARRGLSASRSSPN